MLKTRVVVSLLLFFLWLSLMFLIMTVRADENSLVESWSKPVGQWQLNNELIAIPKPPDNPAALLNLMEPVGWVSKPLTQVNIVNHCDTDICRTVLLETVFSEDIFQPDIQNVLNSASEALSKPQPVSIISIAVEALLSPSGSSWFAVPLRSSMPQFLIPKLSIGNTPLSFMEDGDRDRKPSVSVEMPDEFSENNILKQMKAQSNARKLPYQPSIIQESDEGVEGERLLYVDREGLLNIAPIIHTPDARHDFIEVGSIYYFWLNDGGDLVRGQQYGDFWLNGLPTGHDFYLDQLTILLGRNGTVYRYINAEGETVYAYYDKHGQLHIFTTSELKRLLSLYHQAELERLYPVIFGIVLPAGGGVAPEHWQQERRHVPFPVLRRLERLRLKQTDSARKSSGRGAASSKTEKNDKSESFYSSDREAVLDVIKKMSGAKLINRELPSGMLYVPGGVKPKKKFRMSSNLFKNWKELDFLLQEIIRSVKNKKIGYLAEWKQHVLTIYSDIFKGKTRVVLEYYELSQLLHKDVSVGIYNQSIRLVLAKMRLVTSILIISDPDRKSKQMYLEHVDDMWTSISDLKDDSYYKFFTDKLQEDVETIDSLYYQVQ